MLAVPRFRRNPSLTFNFFSFDINLFSHTSSPFHNFIWGIKIFHLVFVGFLWEHSSQESTIFHLSISQSGEENKQVTVQKRLKILDKLHLVSYNLGMILR